MSQLNFSCPSLRDPALSPSPCTTASLLVRSVCLDPRGASVRLRPDLGRSGLGPGRVAGARLASARCPATRPRAVKSGVAKRRRWHGPDPVGAYRSVALRHLSELASRARRLLATGARTPLRFERSPPSAVLRNAPVGVSAVSLCSEGAPLSAWPSPVGGLRGSLRSSGAPLRPAAPSGLALSPYGVGWPFGRIPLTPVPRPSATSGTPPQSLRPRVGAGGSRPTLPGGTGGAGNQPADMERAPVREGSGLWRWVGFHRTPHRRRESATRPGIGSVTPRGRRRQLWFGFAGSGAGQGGSRLAGLRTFASDRRGSLVPLQSTWVDRAVRQVLEL